MQRTRKAHLLPLVFSLAACGASEGTAVSPTREPEVAPVTVSETRPEEAPEPVVVPGAGPYEVHEWGVIDVQEDGRAEIAAGAGRPGLATPPPSPRPDARPDRPMPVRKPVLYFHLDPGAGPLAITASARLVGGTIYETYPSDTRPSPDVAAWAATLTEGTCRTLPDGDPSIRDARPAPLCATPDGICEVHELPRYDASSASCVAVDGTSAGMLFYRGMSTANLPLTITRGADFVVHVTNDRLQGAPGAILRVSTNLSGPWPMGHVVISRVGIPAIGASTDLPVGTIAVDRTASRAELDAALTTLGLDDAERGAFLGEWMTPFFGPEPGASGRASDGSPPVPQDAVIYFLSEPGVSDIAVLELAPAPRTVRRAFMVRVIFPSSPTA
jgi:hypothetical protein